MNSVTLQSVTTSYARCMVGDIFVCSIVLLFHLLFLLSRSFPLVLLPLVLYFLCFFRPFFPSSILLLCSLFCLLFFSLISLYLSFLLRCFLFQSFLVLLCLFLPFLLTFLSRFPLLHYNLTEIILLDSNSVY